MVGAGGVRENCSKLCAQENLYHGEEICGIQRETGWWENHVKNRETESTLITHQWLFFYNASRLIVVELGHISFGW